MMLPPGQTYLFYSFQHKDVINKLLPLSSSSKFQPLYKKYINKPRRVILKQLNFLNLPIQDNLISQGYQQNFSILPRTKQLIYIPPDKPQRKDKEEWSLSKSIFKDYQIDNDEILKKCFEFDWSFNRCHRFIKDENDLNQVKETLYSHYKLYKQFYKYYSSLNPIGENWCIQSFEFNQIVAACNLIDDKLRQQDIDLKFVATNANPETRKLKHDPERGLVRFELNECFVRIAEEKYIKSKQLKTYEEAVKKLYEDHLLEEMKKYEKITINWRTDQYWTYQCELVLKHYIKIINRLYEMYSGKKALPGEKKFMCVEELMEMTKKAELCLDETFQEVDVYVSFNLSMMTQVDELDQSRFIKMNLLEFYEALARIADKKALNKVGVTKMQLEDRQKQQLHFKIESLIHHLFKKCFTIEQQNAYLVHDESIFDSDTINAIQNTDDEQDSSEQPLSSTRKFQNIVSNKISQTNFIKIKDQMKDFINDNVDNPLNN